MPTKDNKNEPPARRATRSRSGTRATSKPKRTPTEEEIRIRAYELFEARGGEHGHEREDWERAERELSSTE